MNMFTFIAPVYDKVLYKMHSRHKDALLNKISPLSGEKILDVGGGTGRLARELSEAGAKASVVDASEAMLKQARRILPPNQVILGMSEHLPFDNDSFDFLTMVDTLHHIRLQDETLRECLRVLKPNGTLLILEFTPQSLYVRALRRLERIAGEPGLFLTPQDLETKLASAGYEDIKTEHLTKHEYLVQGKKPLLVFV
jgi:demethylmenaquinone methyltransferase/2-methoxy-6-polyprenyl-1,4-benzoquinol methylase